MSYDTPRCDDSFAALGVHLSHEIEASLHEDHIQAQMLHGMIPLDLFMTLARTTQQMGLYELLRPHLGEAGLIAIASSIEKVADLTLDAFHKALVAHLILDMRSVRAATVVWGGREHTMSGCIS